MLFGHWFEIIVLLVLALVVFGPKRMIEMGSQLGKMVRELRESTKDLNWQAMLRGDEMPEQQTTLSHLSQVSQSFGAQDAAEEPASEAPAHVVEGSAEPVEESPTHQG